MLNNLAAIYGDTVAVSNSYESIQTVTVGAGGSASITFSSIPSIYKHLQVRGILRSTEVAVANVFNFRFNGDTGANYSTHNLYGDGASVGANAFSSTTFMYGPDIPCASAAANIFGSFVTDVLDYTNTSKYKTSRHLGGSDRNGSGALRLTSNSWQSTAAINSITIFPPGGANWAQYSSFALYGIKG